MMHIAFYLSACWRVGYFTPVRINGQTVGTVSNMESTGGDFVELAVAADQAQAMRLAAWLNGGGENVLHDADRVALRLRRT